MNRTGNRIILAVRAVSLSLYALMLPAASQALELKSGVWTKVNAAGGRIANFTFTVPANASHIDCTASETNGTGDATSTGVQIFIAKDGVVVAQGGGIARLAKVTLRSPSAGVHAVTYRAASPVTYNATCRTAIVARR